MAEGFALYYGAGKLEVYSAGSRPSGEVNPQAVKVMAEAGIDISAQRSKGFNDLPIRQFDYAVTLGCQDICPLVPAERHIEWEIEDPAGKDSETFRRVRDEIKEKVMGLLGRE